jgi:hypothetical protein
MVPDSWLSILFFLLLIAPGLFHDLLDRRGQIRPDESAFREISRTVFTSIVISAVSFSLLAVVRAIRPEWIPDPRLFFSRPGSYFADHYGLVLRTFLIEGVVGLTIAGGYSLIRNASRSDQLKSVSSWTRVFRDDRPKGTRPYVQVRLADGTTYVGQVGHFTADLQTADRELVLVPPLFVKKPGGALKDMPSEWQRIVLAGESIQNMVVQYRRS